MRLLCTIILALLLAVPSFGANLARVKLDKTHGPKDRELSVNFDSDGLTLDAWQGEVSLRIGMIDVLMPFADSIVTDELNNEARVQLWGQYFYYDMFIKADGNLEWSAVLNQKLPGNRNSITFDIETEGLDFFYQPALTQAQIDSGYNRPDSVVGSYAIYRSAGSGNYPNGKNYMTGKVGHIYRPYAFDAEGDTVWCVLFIDTVAGTMTITLPNNYLKNAVYPVTIDPQFGNTAAGASESSSIPDNRILGPKITNSGSEGTVDSLVVHQDGTGFSSSVLGMVLYGDSTSTIKNYIDSSVATQTWSNTSPQWRQYPAIEGATVKVDSVYFIGVVYSSGTGNRTLFYDMGSTGDEWFSIDVSPADVPSASVDNVNDRLYSMYVVYTATAASDVPQVIMITTE